MHAYKEKDRYIIEDRGLVMIVHHSMETDPIDLLDTYVLIDEKEYLVKGVETFAMPYHKSIREMPIGLLVKP